MLRKKVLLVAWEFPGYNSEQGTALSRRVGQISDGLLLKGAEVTVIHNDQQDELDQDGFYITNSKSIDRNITRIVSRYTNPKRSCMFKLIMVLRTYWQLLTMGDYSGKWALATFDFLKDEIEKPDIIIGFFTPRGPLLLANKLGNHMNVPIIFDFQDNISIGLRREQLWISLIWMRKLAKSAAAIVHVSPEWAKADGKLINYHINYIRHAIASNQPMALPIIRQGSSKLKLLYSGTLKIGQQDTSVLIEALERLSQKGFEVSFIYAGDLQTARYFKSRLTYTDFDYRGWLSKKELYSLFDETDCFLLFGWQDNKRQVVPSKIFEFLTFNKPILISGNDTGSLKVLLEEWEVENIIHEDVEYLEQVLIQGFSGNFEHYLLPSNCKNVVDVSKLVERYSILIDEVIEN